jgi:hypothetical protein
MKNNLLLGILPFVILCVVQLACVPPQDCIGTDFRLRGQIVNAQHEPIEGATARIFNNGSYERPAFDTTTVSDEAGYFQMDSVFSYACTEFALEIKGAGYKAFSMDYYPPSSEGWPNMFVQDAQIVLESD